MPKPKIDYERIREKILVISYNEYVHDGELYNSVEDISRFIGEAKNVTMVCLGPLTTDGLMSEGRKSRSLYTFLPPPDIDSIPSGTFTLTDKGRKYVESIPDRVYDNLMSEMSEWTEWDCEDARKDTEAWEPLALDRSTSTYKTAVERTEEALREIESNNGYADRYPEERESIVYSIRGSLDYVKNSVPTHRHIRTGLLAPLKYLAEKFAGSAIGEAAKIAVSALVTWLGSLHS